MTTRTLSQTSLDAMAHHPPAKRGPGFRTISVASYSTSSTDDSVNIPDDLDSKEFLAFCGLSSEASDSIWRSWSNRISENDLLFDYAISYIKEKASEKDAIKPGDDWNSALHHMGMSSDAQQRIMDPAFIMIRLTGCACSWALDTVTESFHFLKGLEDAVGKKRQEREISRVSSPAENLRPKPAIRPQDHRAASSSSSNRDSATPQVYFSAATQEFEGRTVFFKGGAENRLRKAINEDGTLNLRQLQSQPPTDFHPEKSTYLYLTKHQEVAIKYAQYAEARVEGLQAAIFQIAIPNNLIANAREIYGNDWRDLVWNSRNEKVHETTFMQLPVHIQHFQDYDVLVSNLCNDSPHKIIDMEDKSELSEFKLTNGRKASQLVIQTISRQKEIARNSIGFFWVSLYVSASRAKDKKNDKK